MGGRPDGIGILPGEAGKGRDNGAEGGLDPRLEATQRGKPGGAKAVLEPAEFLSPQREVGGEVGVAGAVVGAFAEKLASAEQDPVRGAVDAFAKRGDLAQEGDGPVRRAGGFHGDRERRREEGANSGI